MTNRTTVKPTVLGVSLLAAALAALATSGGGALADPAGGAQIAERGFHHFRRGPVCRFYGVRLPERFVRLRARAIGYRRIHDIRFVPRLHGRYNWCGFYRAEAMLRGRPFVIFADAHTGRVIGRQRPGRIGRSTRQNLSAATVRSILRRKGYRHIRNIRYVRRGGRDFYMARARRGGWVVRLRIDDESGRIIQRQRLRRYGAVERHYARRGVPNLSQRQMRALLRAKGYRRIRDVRYQQTAEARGYVATADFDNVPYRLHVSGTTGKVESKRRLRH
jgi:hypothetical protein